MSIIHYHFHFHNYEVQDLYSLGFRDAQQTADAYCQAIRSDFPNWHCASHMFYCAVCGETYCKVTTTDAGKILPYHALKSMCVGCGQRNSHYEPPGSVWLSHDITYRHNLPEYILRREAFLAADWSLREGERWKASA